MATAKSRKAKAASVAAMSCSDGWYITGYYTASEDQFHGNPVSVTVKGVGADQFPSDFLSAVRLEGWGLTRHGWYLGWSTSQGWISGPAALNARGQPLQRGSLAVDRHVVPLGTKVRITNLPAPWNQQAFVADDTGGAINGKHVDVYCGAGPQALAETKRVTTHGGRVCLG